MNFTFLSKSQGRTLDLESLVSLDTAQLRELHAELLVATQSMEDCVFDATTQAAEKGTTLDHDWIHRVKKKRRICVAFTAQVKQLLDTATGPKQAYQVAYLANLERLVRDEVGSAVFEALADEARLEALANLQAPALGA